MTQDNTIQATNIPQEKPGKKKKLIVVVLSCVLVICIAIGILLALDIFKVKKKELPLVENTFYSAMYHNTPVLFYKYPGLLSGLKPVDPTVGVYVAYTNAMSPMSMNMMMDVQYVDFRKLQNPRKLFSFDRYATIENIRLSPDKTYLVLSIVGGNSDNTNAIYQVNVKTFVSKKVWEHTLRIGPAPLNQGFAYVTQFVPDHFVIFDIIQGNPPPTEMPKGTIIVNAASGNQKVLGVTGDERIDLTNDTVSYKVLHTTPVPCEGGHDPVCFPGDRYKNIFTPSGKVFTQSLP